MQAPAVTIVTPVFRRLNYLEESLESALAQTYRDFEIIVTDDGPSPEIAKRVDSYRDPRIRYRHNGRNLGIAMNHLAAYREARGRYITNLDDDDYWKPDFLEKLVPPLEADPTLAVAFCDHYLIDETGHVHLIPSRKNSRFYRREDLAPGRHQPFTEMAVVYEAIPMAMGSVFRKSLLDDAPYPPNIGGSYDYWLSYLATRTGQAAYYVPERLSYYRVHRQSGSLTRGWRNYRNAIYVRSQFLKDPRLAPYHAAIRNSLGVCYGKLALLYWDRQSFRRSRIIRKRAFSLLNQPRTILGLAKNFLVRQFAGSRS